MVNLYPFAATIARAGVTLDEAIEQIDIGGPSLIRAAAKNHAFITVATDPDQYAGDSRAARCRRRTTTLELRRRLARRGLRAHGRLRRRRSPTIWRGRSSRRAVSRRIARRARSQGSAALRRKPAPAGGPVCATANAAAGASLVSAQQLHGKELSYNNLLDLDSALAIVAAAAGSGGRGHQAQQSLRRGHGRRTGRRRRGRRSTAIR